MSAAIQPAPINEDKMNAFLGKVVGDFGAFAVFVPLRLSRCVKSILYAESVQYSSQGNTLGRRRNQ